MGDEREFADIARDGYLNGNNAEIVKIARETAKNLAKMYTNANAPKENPNAEKVISEDLVVKTSQNKQPQEMAKKPNLPQLPGV